MTLGNQIRKLFDQKQNTNEWPAELAQPNHILWRLGQHLCTSNNIANRLAIQDFLAGLRCPDDSKCVEALFFGMVNLLKVACCTCHEDKNILLGDAGKHYSALLKGFHDDQVILKWGKMIAELTYSKLKNNGQAKEALTNYVGSTTILTTSSTNIGYHIPLLVEKCTQYFSEEPALIYDPIRIGLINFDLEKKNNFLQASVFPAWQLYLAEFKEASQSMVFSFSKMPSSLATLTGSSAGAAFFLALKSAHLNIPLDPTIAISVAIIKKDEKFILNKVTGIEQKKDSAKEKKISKILVYDQKKQLLPAFKKPL